MKNNSDILKQKFRLANQTSGKPLFAFNSNNPSQENFKSLLDKKIIRRISKGSYSFHGMAGKLIDQFDLLFKKELRSFKAREVSYPEMVSKKLISRLRYPGNFIQNLSRKHKMYTRSVYLPAACLPCYDQLEGTCLGTPLFVMTTRNTIRRNEPQYSNPHVMRRFDMREFIFIGNNKEVRGALNKALQIMQRVAMKLNFNFTVNLSADSFYERYSAERALFQLLNKSKIELRAYAREINSYVPILSSNYHGTYFSREFKIYEKKNFACTGCFAFGLQRWVLIFLGIYGADQRQWPSTIRKFLE